MRQLSKRTSRRVETLKDSDYDHEIGLVDEERRGRRPHPPDSQPGASVPESSAPAHSRTPPIQEAVDRQDQFQDAREEFTPRPSNDTQPDTQPDDDEDSINQGASRREEEGDRALDAQTTQPSIAVEGPTPFERDGPATNGTPQRPKSKHEDRETAIDILWENERGCFVCGTALFSGAALGNLDPSPWTNQFHKTSPTNISTAQVPDPSWEWAWPEWRINREEGVAMDEFGWEYSFMFSKKFSWHGPRWWNSFVRRRAWIRKRVKKKAEDLPSDPHMLNTDYFNITPARSRSRSSSVLSARASVPDGGSINSKLSMGQLSKGESLIEEKPDIEDVWMLLMILRAARIDREKIEAVENYLQNARDGLEELQDHMHDIMSLFVFQASRRLLLSRLTQVYDELGNLEKGDADGAIKEKRRHLGAAIKHADEEVKRLSYWSDVKKVTQEGTSRGAVDENAGWPEDWQGVDQSGPAAPKDAGKLP